MIDVNFRKYPKEGKQFFKTKGWGRWKKSMALQDADEAIRNFAKTLNTGEKAEVEIQIDNSVDGNGEIETSTIDTFIDKDDVVGGLSSLIRKDAEATRQENGGQLSVEEETAVDELIDEIENELGDDESEDEDDYGDEDYNDDDYNSTVEIDKQVETPSLSSPKNETQSQPDSAPQAQPPAGMFTEDDEDLLNPDYNASSDTDENGTKETQTDEDNSKFEASNNVENIEKSVDSAPEEPEKTLLTYDKYADPQDIYDRLPQKYNLDSFDYLPAKKELGYVDEPKDEWEKQHNAMIDKALRDTGVKDIQKNYDELLSKNRAAVIDNLNSNYYQINSEELEECVDNQVTSKYRDLESAANKEKEQNNSNFEKRKAIERQKHENQDNIALQEFKEKLENQRKIDLAKFDEELEAKTQEDNKAVDVKLKADKEHARRIAYNKEIANRNQKLQDARRDVANRFETNVRENYNKLNHEFTEGFRKVIDILKADNAKIQQEKEAERIKQEEAKRAEEEAARAKEEREREDRRNLIKERELDRHDKSMEMMQKTLEMTNKTLSEIAKIKTTPVVSKDETSSTINKEKKSEEDKRESRESKENPTTVNNYYQVLPSGQVMGQKAAMQMVPPYPTQILPMSNDSAMSDREIDEKIAQAFQNLQNKTAVENKEKENEELKKALAAAKENKDHWKLGMVTCLAVACLSAFIIGIKPNVVTTNVAPSTETRSKPATSPKVMARTIKIKTEKASDFEKYQSLKSWVAKKDMLDGLLGQKDVRTLKKIATEDPTSLAILYYQLASGEKNQARSTWSSMSAKHRAMLSDDAKQQVGHAFGEVSDWQNRWLATHAY